MMTERDDLEICRIMKMVKTTATDFFWKTATEIDDEKNCVTELLGLLSYMYCAESIKEGADDDFVIRTLKILFENERTIVTGAKESKESIDKLMNCRISERLSMLIFDILYFVHILRKIQFYKENTELNLNIDDSEFYCIKREELTVKMGIDYCCENLNDFRILEWLERAYYGG